jgi:hypothetical protein
LWNVLLTFLGKSLEETAGTLVGLRLHRITRIGPEKKSTRNLGDLPDSGPAQVTASIWRDMKMNAPVCHILAFPAALDYTVAHGTAKFIQERVPEMA